MPNEQPDGSGVDPNDTTKGDKGIEASSLADRSIAGPAATRVCTAPAAALKRGRETVAQRKSGSDPVQNDSSKGDKGL